jgi:hypothetical protein
MGSNVTMTADTPGRRRPGGQPKPKDQKRVAVNLRMSPALHARLVAMANEHGRSITQQAEMLLDQAFEMQAVTDEIFTRLAEMRNSLDQQRAEALKQLREHEEWSARWLRELDEREARAFRELDKREAHAFRELDKRERALLAREIKGKRKP